MVSSSTLDSTPVVSLGLFFITSSYSENLKALHYLTLCQSILF